MRSVTAGSQSAGPAAHVNESQRASRRVQRQRKADVKVRAADALCKDLVNEPKRLQQSAEGSSTVTFLGAGGKEMSVECPKVSVRRLGRPTNPLSVNAPCTDPGLQTMLPACQYVLIVSDSPT